MSKHKSSGAGESCDRRVPSAKPPRVPVSKHKSGEVVKSVVLNEIATADGDSTPVDTSPPVPLKRKRTSESWNEFDQIEVDGKVVKGKCKHCKLNIGAKSENGTSGLNKHLKRCFAFKTSQKKVNQMYLEATMKGDGTVAAFNFKFNQEVTRDRIARMIILHELPFSMVEYVGFRMVLTSLQPNIKLVKRNTERSDCIKVYNYEKKLVYETFSKLQSRISLTTDMWTCTTQNKGYLALTAHYIDEKWRMQKRILSFTPVDGQHTGENISKVLMDKLLEWNIDRKIASITLDNASTNGVVVSELIDKLKADDGLLLNGKLFQVRCSAHVIAIIVDYGMLQIKEEIQKVRNSVKFIRSSPQRQHKFEEVCLQVNAPKKKLIQDVDTRWNSTYMMLQTALQFREAFSRYGRFEPEFLKVAPGEEDWNNASSLSTCLKVFYEITLLFSDLEQYLMDDALHVESGTVNLNDSSFDVLGWWKFYGPKYPIVALMARDILAIPASSVASESVFSTSGRVVDKYRSSMLPETIEALICGQDWIRSALESEGLGLDNPSLKTVLDAVDQLQEGEGDGTDSDVNTEQCQILSD